MEQLSLFDVEKDPKKKKPLKPLSDVEILTRRFNELRGPLVGQPEWNKARGQAKLVLQHASLDDALKTLDWMLKNEFYQTHAFSIAAIGKAVKRWRVEHESDEAKKRASDAIWAQLKNE